MNRVLSDFQVDILALANEGLSNREIAEAVSRPFACIITTFTNIKRKGHRLPEHRPLDATAERAHRVRERHQIDNCKAAPRFTAKGRKKSTGEKFEITSDSQEHSDKWLAYMVGVGT